MTTRHSEPQYLFILLGITILLLSGCNNDEGFGGNAHIRGTLIEKAYNDDFSRLIYQKPAADEKVFLVFGDNDFVSEDVTSDFNGNFQFSYLRKGSYKVFYYSLDTLSAYNVDKEVVYEINIDENLTYNLGDLEVIKTLDWDEGSAVIKGRVFVINYYNSSSWPNLVVKDTALAQEQEIYITYQNHTFYDDRIRTQFDGTFEFNHLIPGDYLVFLYSEDVTGATQNIVIQKQVSVQSEFQEIDLGDIFIEKL